MNAPTTAVLSSEVQHVALDGLTPSATAVQTLRRAREKEEAGGEEEGGEEMNTTPDGFAVVTPDGHFVGCFRNQENASLVANRSPSSRGERIAPVYFAPPFDLIAHLHRQCAFSLRTFGPGERTQGLIDHIQKELDEIADDPTDLSEWIDVVILALDGAWRIGATSEQIVAALLEKQAKNEARQWPDWRTAAPGKAIEHVKD